MGLTVNCEFEFRGSTEALRRKLEWLRGRFQDLPVLKVGEAVEIEKAVFPLSDAHRHEGTREERALGLSMALYYFKRPEADKAISKYLEGIKGLMNLPSRPVAEQVRYARLERQAKAAWDKRIARIENVGNGIMLKVEVGEGCELFTVQLGRLGRGTLWRGGSFTKTQYALHFVQAHLTVIKMLDLCKEAGVLREVKDEGHFWETRDLKVLAENINASTQMLKKMVPQFKEIGRKIGIVGVSEIEKAENYMMVKEEGKTK